MIETVTITHTGCSAEMRIPLRTFMSDMEPGGKEIRCPVCGERMNPNLSIAIGSVASGMKTVFDNNNTQNKFGDPALRWKIELA